MWSDRFDLIQSRLCLEQFTAPSMCVCVCVFLIMHSSGKFVPLCKFTQCVKDCIIVYACTLCVCVCADKVSPHISTLCLRVVDKVNSPVIPPPPVVCGSC